MPNDFYLSQLGTLAGTKDVQRVSELIRPDAGVFSKKSQDNLATCHPLLIVLMNHVVRIRDCSILTGHRGKEEQNAAYENGNSKVKWPNGRHNKIPSMAVDAQPYPYKEGDLHSFYHFVGVVYGVAGLLDIQIRQGADWNGNLDFKDESFVDLFHIELV